MGSWQVTGSSSSNILRSKYETNRYIGAMALTLSLAVPMTVQAEENGTDMVLAAKSVAGEFKTALQEAAP